MHGLEASPSAWLREHAHWGRYLVLALPEVGWDIGGGSAAIRDAFFPGKMAQVAQNVAFPTWKGFIGNLPDLAPYLYTSSDRVLIPLLCGLNIIHFFIKPHLLCCYYVPGPGNTVKNKANKAFPSQNKGLVPWERQTLDS